MRSAARRARGGLVVRRGPRRSLALDREGDDVAAPDVDELSGAPAVAAVREEVADAHELGGASAGGGRILFFAS